MVMVMGLGAGLRTTGVWISLGNRNGSRKPQVAIAGSLWGLNPASFWPEGDFVSSAVFQAEECKKRWKTGGNSPKGFSGAGRVHRHTGSSAVGSAGAPLAPSLCAWLPTLSTSPQACVGQLNNCYRA